MANMLPLVGVYISYCNERPSWQVLFLSDGLSTKDSYTCRFIIANPGGTLNVCLHYLQLVLMLQNDCMQLSNYGIVKTPNWPKCLNKIEATDLQVEMMGLQGPIQSRGQTWDGQEFEIGQEGCHTGNAPHWALENFLEDRESSAETSVTPFCEYVSILELCQLNIQHEWRLNQCPLSNGLTIGKFLFPVEKNIHRISWDACRMCRDVAVLLVQVALTVRCIMGWVWIVPRTWTKHGRRRWNYHAGPGLAAGCGFLLSCSPSQLLFKEDAGGHAAFASSAFSVVATGRAY